MSLGPGIKIRVGGHLTELRVSYRISGVISLGGGGGDGRTWKKRETFVRGGSCTAQKPGSFHDWSVGGRRAKDESERGGGRSIWRNCPLGW